MSDKIFIINGHPDPAGGHFCHALSDAYAEGARESGHEIRRIDDASISFPLLRTKQEFDRNAQAADILTTQEAVVWADHLVIIYPLWLGTMPALLKALFEQVFRPGFAFENTSTGWPGKLLKGRTARIVITMGMPAFWYRWYYRAHSLKSLERNILKFCGIRPSGETILGMVEAASDAKRAKWLKHMRSLGSSAR